MKYEVRLAVTAEVEAENLDEAEMRAIALIAIAGVRDASVESIFAAGDPEHIEANL